MARRQILAICEATLAKADVQGVLPTPLQSVAKAANIAEIVDIGHLPDELAKRKPSALKGILGALVFRERVVYVDFAQTEPRARLTEAHEIGHRILPWHQAAFMLDDEERLLGNTCEELELQAYAAAGHLIFQGQRFHKQALDYQVSMNCPMALADGYGASIHATIRYYVQHHPADVGLLIAGRYADFGGYVPVWHSVESPSFLHRFGVLKDRVNGRLPVAGGKGKPLGDIAHSAMTAQGIAANDVGLRDLDGEHHDFVAEAFFNQYNLLVMLSRRKARRLGRRVRVAARQR